MDDVDLYIFWVPIHYYRLRINYLFGKYESVRGCRWRFGLAFFSCWASRFMVWCFVCNTHGRFLSRVVFFLTLFGFFWGGCLMIYCCEGHVCFVRKKRKKEKKGKKKEGSSARIGVFFLNLASINLTNVHVTSRLLGLFSHAGPQGPMAFITLLSFWIWVSDGYSLPDVMSSGSSSILVFICHSRFSPSTLFCGLPFCILIFASCNPLIQN